MAILLLGKAVGPSQVAPGRVAPLPPSLALGLPQADEVRVISAGDPSDPNGILAIFWPGGQNAARRAIELLSEHPTLTGLPQTVPSSARLYLAPDAEVWDILTGGQVPDWGAGVAIPDRSMAVIPLFEAPVGGVRDRDRTVLHEWAHLGLHEYLDGLRIPRWFDEGYAQRVSGGWDIEQAWRLRIGLTRAGAPSLDSLSLDWPRGRNEAELAYLLAGSAVQYLAEESGPRGFEVLLTRWRDVEDFEEAFRRTFGYTTGTFETRWIEHVRRRYGWALILTQTAVFWTFVALAMLGLVQVRAQRNRERVAHLRATQPPSRPAYWAGPPTPPIGGFSRRGEGAEELDPTREPG